MITEAEIQYFAQVHKQIAEKVDLTKPLPQEIEVEMEMNLVVDKPRAAFVLSKRA